MSEIDLTKNKLIEELWIPKAIKGGSIFYPRLIYKKMKLLTLTNDENFEEVGKFMENKLTHKQLVIAWNHDRIKAIRLETEGIANKTLGATRYEDSIVTSSHQIFDHFPFDIINLDFSSQEPEPENGRIENEILGLEKTIQMQKERGQDLKGFVLIYTTLINSIELNCETIIQNCDRTRIQGWSGLSLNGFNPNATDQMEKIRIIETVLNQLSSKYNYNIELNKADIELSEEGELICSIAGIIK